MFTSAARYTILGALAVLTLPPLPQTIKLQHTLINIQCRRSTRRKDAGSYKCCRLVSRRRSINLCFDEHRCREAPSVFQCCIGQGTTKLNNMLKQRAQSHPLAAGLRKTDAKMLASLKLRHQRLEHEQCQQRACIFKIEALEALQRELAQSDLQCTSQPLHCEEIHRTCVLAARAHQASRCRHRHNDAPKYGPKCALISSVDRCLQTL
mmetsp:Transcript_151983/g.487920  ORF Transcript_151983/g.487920 Transcript_151983/m.487920 type:complete len:208 (+) Transcript_151983:24-647(+)